MKEDCEIIYLPFKPSWSKCTEQSYQPWSWHEWARPDQCPRQFDVEPLSSIDGAQLSLRKSLCYVAGDHARNHQLPISASQPLTVLIQGDGRNITASRQTTLVAYHLPQLVGLAPNSPDNVHPVVIIDDDESYDAYVRGLETFWSALLDIKASGLNVPGVGVVPVVFKMCCDMKALLLFAGLGSANSNHACFHCCEPLACRACCLPEVRSACELGHPFDALTISRDVGLAAASFDDCKMPVSEQAIVFSRSCHSCYEQ